MPPAFSSPKKVSKRGIKGDGRPSKLTAYGDGQVEGSVLIWVER